MDGSYTNTFVYDSAGYRDTVSNNNTGTVSFDFTALGELRLQTDAKGSTTYDYDLLRRITSIDDPDGIAIWQYDPTDAKGALDQRCYYSTGSTGTSCSNETSRVFHETLGYDSDARLISAVPTLLLVTLTGTMFTAITTTPWAAQYHYLSFGDHGRIQLQNQ